jgi:hypothetical protein
MLRHPAVWETLGGQRTYIPDKRCAAAFDHMSQRSSLLH